MSDLRQIISMDLFVTLPGNGDERVKDWPLMKSIWPTFFIVFFYVLITIFGQKWMKSRNSFKLRVLIFLHNFLQIILCAYITYESAYVWVKGNYSLLCQPIDFSERPLAIRGCKVCWWFYIMKLVDLIDTIILIARKANNQITLLHVYYHVTMTFFSWLSVRYVPGGQTLFIVIISSFTNVLICTYHAFNMYPPPIQMFQFLPIILHSIVNLQQPCNYPKIFDITFLVYSITILILSANFYLPSYMIKKRHSKNKYQLN